MARNVEIKARVRDLAFVRKRAQDLCTGLPEVMEQEDIFFPSQRGRLKLRQLAPDEGQLIYYERPDLSGPKTSTYSISHTQNPAQLRDVLASALGEVARVKKVREVFIVGQTRIHLDVVEGLGEFMELEVALSEKDTELSGQNTAFTLMEQLGIEKADLVEGAYADLLSGDDTG